MNETIEAPAGFHFAPFDDEIINLYLKPKILRQELPCNLVEEIQLYGPDANPWQLFDPEKHSWILSEVTPGKFEKNTYVFVNLTRKGTGPAEGKKKGKRDNYIKTAGCGTWDGQTKRTEIRDSNGDLIGERRMLSFEINEVCDQDLNKVGRWRMHEYLLSGVNKNISNPDNTVLCRIILDSSKKPPVKLKLRAKGNLAHPIKTSKIVSSSSTVNIASVECNQGVSESSEGAITTQTRRDDSVVSDTDKVKGKEGCYETENVETSDGEECVKSCYVEEDTPVIASLPSKQVKTGYLNPSIFDFHWPAKNDNDCKKIEIESGKGDLDLDMTKVQFSKEEQPVEDTTTKLG